MRTKRFFSILSAMLTLLILFNLTGCRNVNVEETSKNFAEMIDSGDTENITLTIYYLSPFVLTYARTTEDKLIEDLHDFKIIITGDKLMEHVDLLEKISKINPTPVKEPSKVIARIYYAFQNENGDTLLSVSMWGANNSIFVNGIECEGDDIFYDMIIPFLPSNAVEELKNYLAGNWPD